MKCIGCNKIFIKKHFNTRYCTPICKNLIYKKKYGYSEYKKQYETINRDKIRINQQKFRENNRDRLREYTKLKARQYRKENPEKYRIYKRKLNLIKRLNAINEYGSKCACCGEMETKFLTFDHINSDGAKDRRENKRVSGNFINYLLNQIKLGRKREDIQLLCWNCNCSKGFYGTCPHIKVVT